MIFYDYGREQAAVKHRAETHVNITRYHCKYKFSRCTASTQPTCSLQQYQSTSTSEYHTVDTSMLDCFKKEMIPFVYRLKMPIMQPVEQLQTVDLVSQLSIQRPWRKQIFSKNIIITLKP